MPTPTITTRDLETVMDGFAYLLSNDSRTSNINWILGDVGMGAPVNLPFGYISVQDEVVSWYTANGGMGGLAAGLDDWVIRVILTVCTEPHDFIPPVAAQPPNTSPFNPSNLGGPIVYQEQPGWRTQLEIIQNIKKVMRTTPGVVVFGAATDTRIVESRWVMAEINEKLYRAARLTIQTQQRRVRGN